MDANSGEPWSKTDIDDLKAFLAFGNGIAATANMLQGRGQGASEGERTGAGRAPWETYPDRPLEPAPHGDQQASPPPPGQWHFGPLVSSDR